MLRRLFISRKTLYVSLISIILFNVSFLVFGAFAKMIEAVDFFDISAKLLLSGFIFYGCIKENSLVMQAGSCGLLISSVHSQFSYIYLTLLARDTEKFIMIGFFGAFLPCR